MMWSFFYQFAIWDFRYIIVLDIIIIIIIKF